VHAHSVKLSRIVGDVVTRMVTVYNKYMSSKRVSLIGVPIDSIKPIDAVEKIFQMLSGSSKHHVMTPNNEMLVQASGNESFHSVLCSSSLNLPDSTGLIFATALTGQRLPARVTGVDTVTELCKRLTDDYPVFFLGSAPGIADQAAKNLKSLNPSLNIAGTHAGSPSADEAKGIIDQINSSGAVLLLVAYGSPKQDMWIAKYFSSLKNIRVAMGVGGTFDFISGKARRAPKIIRMTGLEWLWRLILQPLRFGRIWNAVVIFPLLVVRYGKKSPYCV